MSGKIRFISLIILTVSLLACSNPQLTVSEIEASVAKLSDGAPSFQVEILADGIVEPSEYEKAVIADRDCVASGGYEVSEPAWSSGQLTFTADADYSHAADPEAADARFLGTVRICREKFSGLVGEAWVMQFDKITPSEREAARKGVIDCLSAAGLPVSDENSDEEIFQLVNSDAYESHGGEVSACSGRYYKFFTTSVRPLSQK